MGDDENYEYGVGFEDGRVFPVLTHQDAIGWIDDESAWNADEARYLMRRPKTPWYRILQVNA